MKKTHSANIGGTVFTIEDDAYEHLQAYLHSIEVHFESYPDIAEIVADIEGRIAEQLMQREMSPQVVRMVDVERVIVAMGRTEEFGEQDGEETPPNVDRKLFRDPDQKVIAGVAAGIAAYLGLPPLVVRLLFVLLVFLFGTSLVVYLLLWALLPVASSTTEKLQMRGRPLTLVSIEQGVRDGLAPLPAAARNVAAQGITAAGSLIHLVVVTIARALKWVAGVFVVGVATLGVLFLTVSLVVALVNASAPPLHPAGAEFFAQFGAWQHAFKTFVYLVAVIPLAVIIATALRLFWGVTRLNTRGLAGLLGVWVISLLGSAAIWSGSYPQVRQYMNEYPALAEARRGVDTYGALVATTSPFTDEQASSLLETLAAEYKRHSEEYRGRAYTPGYLREVQWLGPNGHYGYSYGHLEFEEESIKATEESHRRVLDSARDYLDAEQLAVIQDNMTRNVARARANLEERRKRLELSTQRND